MLLYCAAIVYSACISWAIPSNAVLISQQLGSRSPTYDVVSIRQNNAPEVNVRVQTTTNGYYATDVTLKMLLQTAYSIQSYLIQKAPTWADERRFNIDAKYTGDSPALLGELNAQERGAMLIAVLKDRFHLEAHLETRVSQRYKLSLAPGGPRLAAARIGSDYKGGITGPDGRSHLGLVQSSDEEIVGQAITMRTLAITISRQLQAPVVDDTGLTGVYDVRVRWAPERTSLNAGSDSSVDSLPSLFTALQEQLGLKVTKDRGPVTTLVVDDVRLPTEN